VTARHVVLTIGAALVLALGVYLLVEVRADPAAQAPAASPRAERPARVAPPIAPPPVATENAPAATPPRSSDRPFRAAPPPPPVPPPPPHDAAAGSAADPDADLVGPKLDAAMAEANKAYDRGDFEDARAIAGRLLAKLPTNVRMLRIMVSASCIDGDSAVAQAHFGKLPPSDQDQMRARCARYGITFADSR
jgi:hypothetical protein